MPYLSDVAHSAIPMTTKKRRRQKPQPYDFLALPLRDGSFGLGEFINEDNFGAKFCVLYRLRESSAEALRDRLDRVGLEDVIGLAPVSTLEMERGEWLVIGNQASSKRTYIASLPQGGELRPMYTGEIPEEFLEAYHALRSWNDYPMAPKWFRAILRPHLQPPAQAGAPAPTRWPATEAKPTSKPKARLPMTTTKTKRPKRQKPVPHDFFAVPLRDGSCGLGEFIGKTQFGQSICVLYRVRQASPVALRDRLDGVTPSDIIGFAQVATREIERGAWVVIGNCCISDAEILASMPKARESYTGDVIEMFLDAYHSLRSWSEYPKWFGTILLPHLQPPPQDRVLAVTEAAAATESASDAGRDAAPVAPPASSPSTSAAGHAEVHVTIRYEGDGLPDIALLKKRELLETWVEGTHLGEVTDAGGGGGVLDVFFETQHAEKAVPAVKAKLAEMGWQDCTSVEVEPIDDAN